MIGDRHSEGVVLNDLGNTYRILGRHDEALRAFEQAGAQFESVGAFHAADIARKASRTDSPTTGQQGDSARSNKPISRPSESTSLPDTQGARTALSAERHDEFSAFYRNSTPGLVTFLVWQGAGLADAADIVQETMIDAFRRWPNIREPRAWVRRVASQKYARRITASEQPVREVDKGPLISADVDVAEWEQRHDVLRLLAELPARQRQVMAWTLDGYTPADIAQELNLSPDSVRASLRKARSTLVRLLDHAEDAPP